MTDDRLHLPAGAVIATVVLGLMALVGLLLCGASVIAQFVINSPLIPRIPTVRMVAAGLDALVLALVILAVFTVIGLFRLRVWALYSMMLLGLLDLVVFALMSVGVLIVRVRSGMAPLAIPGNPHLTVGAILFALAGLYALLALVGVWWIVYFSARPVREVFADAQARLTP
jgi:hypothetical protein